MSAPISSAAVGLMNEAYFVSRTEILAWIQTTFALPYDSVEQAGTGAFACQVVDSLYPNQVPMSRVSFNAKHEYEFLENYRILQAVFKKLKIDRYIPVDKLTRCKYQDNLEFLQWLHHFWKTNANEESLDYDPVGRRAKCRGGDFMPRHRPAGRAAMTATAAPTLPLSNSGLIAKTSSEPLQRPISARVGAQKSSARPVNPSKTRNQPIEQGKIGHESAEFRQLEQRIVQQQSDMHMISSERDLYYEKLLRVESLCKETMNQTSDNPELVATVQNILRILFEPQQANDHEQHAPLEDMLHQCQLQENALEEIDAETPVQLDDIHDLINQ